MTLPVAEAFRVTNRVLGANPEKFALLAAAQTGGYLIAVGIGVGAEGASFAGFLWLLLATLALSLPAMIATIAAADQALRGTPVHLGDTLGAIGPRYLPFLGLVIVLGIAVGVGTMLLLIPGIYLMVLWFVALPVCVIESAGPIDSLRRSATLTRGNRWQIFGIGVVYFIVTVAVSGLIQLLVLGAPIAFMVMSFVWSAFTSLYGLLLTVTVYRFFTRTTASSAIAPSG